jgi:cytochrome c553
VQRLGIGADAAAPAKAAGLVEIGTRVRFRHPLVRSPAYWAADLADRQEIHRALAEAAATASSGPTAACVRCHARRSASDWGSLLSMKLLLSLRRPRPTDLPSPR